MPLPHGGLVFIRTNKLGTLLDLYLNLIGMVVWLEQPEIRVLQFGNLLVGIQQHDTVCDIDTLITFFFQDRAEVDSKYQLLKELAISEPKVNEKYRIYNFFAKDPDGRRIEFQTFLHPLLSY